ncbi:hypothetical protein EYF80_023362 [Liparis tanakae]|uniref:Uncharacterized protein n=1 Tax=Liparis tanakae TaxID=230148 RepID=A0A4Z2HND1_9TELE|nr:hypothetical protein EYF80_023362 [Liparis tanakae]
MQSLCKRTVSCRDVGFTHSADYDKLKMDPGHGAVFSAASAGFAVLSEHKEEDSGDCVRSVTIMQTAHILRLTTLDVIQRWYASRAMFLAATELISIALPANSMPLR